MPRRTPSCGAFCIHSQTTPYVVILEQHLTFIKRTSMKKTPINKQITIREARSINQFIAEINRIDMVSPEEEARLAEEAHTGNLLAQKMLVSTNLRFAIDMAKQYQNQGLPLGALISLACGGMMEAAIRFDQTKGFKFISYAVYWIQEEISSGLRDESRVVRLPQNITNLSNKISKAYRELEQKHLCEPSIRDIAKHLCMKEKQLSIPVTDHRIQRVSIDASFHEEDDRTMLDTFENPNAPWADRDSYNESLRIEIVRALALLSEIERQVIRLYFGIGIDFAVGLESIADRCALSKVRIYQIKERALSKLRKLDLSLLRSYLG